LAYASSKVYLYETYREGTRTKNMIDISNTVIVLGFTIKTSNSTKMGSHAINMNKYPRYCIGNVYLGGVTGKFPDSYLSYFRVVGFFIGMTFIRSTSIPSMIKQSAINKITTNITSFN